MTRDEMIKVLRYKAENIKAHMEPKFFAEIADYLESQKADSKNRIAKERYEDLVGYFCGDKAILESREEFQKWLARIKWHVKKCDELAREKEAEPCEDAISRRDVIKMIENAQIISDGEYCGYCTEDINIDTLPSVTPKQKTGKWIDARCSECGCDVPAYIFDWKWQKDMNAKYCPNCGAKMESEE